VGAVDISAHGEGYAAVSTPISAGGGIGPQTFNLGSLGIGSKGTLGNSAGQSIPQWVWIAAVVAVGALVLLKAFRK
jgi:hypothetical protein